MIHSHRIVGSHLPFDDENVTTIPAKKSRRSRTPEQVCTDDRERSPWLEILDCTSLYFNFDCSCLESLDDVLLLSPMDSFRDVCWSQAVVNPPRQRTRGGGDDSEESWSSDDDSILTTPVLEKGVLSEATDSAFVGVTDIYTALNKQITVVDRLLYEERDDDSSFIYLDYPVKIRPKPSPTPVSGFPVRPPTAKSKVSTRLRSILPTGRRTRT